MKQHSDIPVERLVIDFSVYYAVAAPAGPAPPRAVLVALHGYGQRCDRFIQPFLPLTRKGVLVVAPQAPNQFYVKMDPKIVGFTWLTRYQRDQSIRDFVNYMERLLARLHERHDFEWSSIYFLGFSQGVSMAYRYAIHAKEPPAGVIACGADLPPDVAERLDRAARFHVWLAHGREDSIVPLQKMQQAKATLRAYQFPTTTYIFPGGHEIPPQLVDQVGHWIIGKM